jgi:hypothetical protein
MKSIIPLLAIPVLVTLALVGCDQNNSSNSANAQSTNSRMSDGTTNMPATNSLPDVNTNTPASTNQ